MIKILYRTLLIILAAGLVAGGLFWYAGNSSASQTALPTGQERPAMPTGTDGSTAAPPAHPEGGISSFSLNGLLGVLAQAGKMAIITAVVAVIQLINQTLQRKHQPKTAPGA